MLRRLALAAIVTAAMFPARPAAADGGVYFFEGFGGSRYRDELERYLGDDGLNIRAGFGWRHGHVAVELWARGEIVLQSLIAARATEPGYVDGPDGSPVVLGADIKVIQPLSTHWSAYARAGLSKMMMEDYAGRGVGATAGIQVAGKVRALGFLAWPFFFLGVGPKVTGAVWFETGTSFHRLHPDSGTGPSVDARIDGWTLGIAIGQDF